jgi:ribosomal protein S18 acetylase RimI-like enzyme
MDERVPVNFTIRERETQQDTEYFIEVEFLSAKENGLIKQDKPEEELFEAHTKELLEFVDGSPKTGIFVAEHHRNYAGLVWVSAKAGGELWDFENAPAWIYDVRVQPEFRRQGLGRKLLSQAENWAQKEGFSKIGLHVFGHNTIAINLYTSSGYTMKNCYFQKEVTPETILKAPHTWTVREKREQDTQHLFDLGFENFKMLAQAGKDVPERVVYERYERFADHMISSKSAHAVHVAEDAGTVVGYVSMYISHGDLGDKKYVWLWDLEVDPQVRGQTLGTQLLAHVESWTMDQGLSTVRTGVHARNEVALSLFRSAGYKKTNIFMEKLLKK